MHPSQDPTRSAAELLSQVDAAIGDAQPESLPELLGQVARIEARLRLGLNAAALPSTSHSIEGDRLLNVAEAAERLGMKKDYLYRHADDLPFTVRVSRGQLRFSARGIEAYIKSRRGRT